MKTSLYKILDLMISLVENAPSTPLGDYKLLKYEDLRDLIEKAITELPSQVADSRELLEREKEIIARAEQKAQYIIDSAKREAKEILNESAVIESIKQESRKFYESTKLDILELEKQTQKKIEESLSKAYREAEEIKENAYAYAALIFEQMEHLNKSAEKVIKSGQAQLKNYAEKPPLDISDSQLLKDKIKTVITEAQRV